MGLRVRVHQRVSVQLGDPNVVPQCRCPSVLSVHYTLFYQMPDLGPGRPKNRESTFFNTEMLTEKPST